MKHPTRWIVASAAATGLVVTTVPIQSAVSAPDSDCPEAVPANDITTGMVVDGLTVTRGTTPDTFAGEVLGTLEDGIAPGLDMIMVQLSGSEITGPAGNVDKGVWAGMSGSPVYTADGRLLGAVAYGLSTAPSDVAGLTPAYEMRQLLTSGAGNSLQADAKVAIPRSVAARLVDDGVMTSSEARAGFQRLPMPFSVSGVSSRRLQKVADRFDIKRRLVVGSAASATAPAVDIIPGGNLVASLSYGDVTVAGTGTATAVCDSEVLAFGHPMLWSGDSTLAMHGANALFIQGDTVFGSFKVANPAAPVGIIDGDRLAGIHGLVGTLPDATDVTSHVASTSGRSRDGQTVITVPSRTPDISAFHLLGNADRVLDKIGAGTARVRWTVEGTRENGSLWEYSRVNRYASDFDITIESIFESYEQLSRILNNRFQDVRITDVNYRATYGPTFHALSIRKFEVRVDGRWITIHGHRPAIRVHAGSDLPVRATLASSDGSGTPRTIRLSVRIPASAGGNAGTLYLQGGGPAQAAPSSFNQLLSNLANAPRNDELSAILRAGPGTGAPRVDGEVVSDVVAGSRHVHLQIR
jgi:hypothetical protein